MKIEAVIFDLGRVLVDVDFSGIFAKYINPDEHSGLSLDLETVMKNPWFQKFSTGKTTLEEFHKNVSDFYKFKINLDDFITEWCSIFKPIPGMQELVKKTSQKMSVELLSDTDPVHWEFLLKEYPVLKIFKNPVLSFKTGFLKPAEICYIKAAKSVDKPVEQCFFIDDREVNVNGAQRAGMQAVRFQSYKKLMIDFKKTNILD